MIKWLPPHPFPLLLPQKPDAPKLPAGIPHPHQHSSATLDALGLGLTRPLRASWMLTTALSACSKKLSSPRSLPCNLLVRTGSMPGTSPASSLPNP